MDQEESLEDGGGAVRDAHATQQLSRTVPLRQTKFMLGYTRGGSALTVQPRPARALVTKEMATSILLQELVGVQRMVCMMECGGRTTYLFLSLDRQLNTLSR